MLNKSNQQGHYIGIHRTDRVAANSICCEGLRLTGHLSSGVIYGEKETPNLDLNISKCDTLFLLIISIFSGCGYRYSGPGSKTGIVIFSIPEDEAAKQALISSKKLDPKCILGYVETSFPFDSKKPIEFAFITPEKAKQEHLKDIKEYYQNIRKLLGPNESQQLI